MLSWPPRPQAISLGPLPHAARVPGARHSGSGPGKHGCAPRASSKQDHRHSRPIPRASVVGVLSAHRCSDRERSRQWRFPRSACPAFWRPGSTRTPLRERQSSQETTDTHNGAWRTWGAPHTGWTLQRKPRGMGREAQAPQGLSAFLLAHHSQSLQKADVKLLIQFIQSFNKHLLSSYYVPGISPGAGGTAINKTPKSEPRGAYTLGERWTVINTVGQGLSHTWCSVGTCAMFLYEINTQYVRPG